MVICKLNIPLVLALVSLLGIPATAAHSATVAMQPSVFVPLDDYIEQARRDWQVPGIAVGVVQDGEVVYAKGYGRREAGMEPSVGDRSLFEIGSLTKAFTATALGLLVEEGKIGWDDVVVDHLPSFRLADPWLTRRVTIRDLVAHRTGIEGGPSVVVPMDSAQVLRGAKAMKSWGPFREMLYSNAMYDIAGEVVAAVSGMTWAEFVQRRIFDPLEMRDSSASADLAGIWDPAHLAPSMYGQAPAGGASITDARGYNVAMPHWHTPEGARPIPWQVSLRGGAAAGSIVSNLHDMLGWLLFSLGDGENAAGRPLMLASTLRELQTPQMLIRDSPWWSFSATWQAARDISATSGIAAYAMGWFSMDYRGHRYLKHRGALLGGMSLIAMIPERRLGVIVLANSYGRDGSGLLNEVIAFRIFDALLGAEPYDWNRAMLSVANADEARKRAAESRLQEVRHQGTRPSLPLDLYAGEYENKEFGPVRIEHVGERLSLRLPGVFNWRLEHWHHDTFRLHVATSGVDLMRLFLTFQINHEGRVTSFDPGWVLLGGSFTPISKDRKKNDKD